MTKFESLRARVLYTRAPVDEEVGSSFEGVGWAGLYMRWEGVGGFILQEDVQQYVTILECADDKTLQAEWERICDALEISGSPDHEDVVVMEDGRTNEYYCIPLGETRLFEEMEDVVHELTEEGLAKNQLWLLNCRGNFIPLDWEDYR